MQKLLRSSDANFPKLPAMKNLLALCLLFTLFPAHAESWASYAQTNEAVLYYDKHRVIKMGSTAMIWDLHDLKAAATDAKGNSYRSVLYATEFNCRMGQHRLLSVQRVAGTMGSGAVVSEETAAGEWREAGTSASADKLMLSACDLK
jgi:hypothetical protein